MFTTWHCLGHNRAATPALIEPIIPLGLFPPGQYPLGIRAVWARFQFFRSSRECGDGRILIFLSSFLSISCQTGILFQEFVEYVYLSFKLKKIKYEEEATG